MMSTPYAINTKCYFRQKDDDEQYNMTCDNFPLHVQDTIDTRLSTSLSVTSSLSFPVQESSMTKEVGDESDVYYHHHHHHHRHHHYHHKSYSIMTDSTEYEINTESTVTKPLPKSQKKVTFVLPSSSSSLSARLESSYNFNKPQKIHSSPRIFNKPSTRTLFFDDDDDDVVPTSRIIRNRNSSTKLEKNKECINKNNIVPVSARTSTTKSILYHLELVDEKIHSLIVTSTDDEQNISSQLLLSSSSSLSSSISITLTNCSFHNNLYFDKLHSNRDKCPRKPIRR